jgi:hypothetical protein
MSIMASNHGVQGGDPSPLGWVEGEIQDGLRSERVRALLLRTVDGTVSEETHVEGSFDMPPALMSMGKAARLVLDDGRRALVVMVSGCGRFHTVGPWT